VTVAESAGAAQDKAIFRIVIAGSQDAIFKELTKTDSPQGAIFNSMLTLASPGLVAGRKMQMRTVSGKRTMVVGEVVEYDPPRRFAHLHRFTQYDDPVCKVIYDLKPVAGGVEVTLTVENVTAGTKTQSDMQSGGMFILNNLKAIVETGRPTFAARLMYWAFGALEFVLPKSTKSENWPL
jgi:Activator of Hsp90 ATPase homolog 1-like protein